MVIARHLNLEVRGLFVRVNLCNFGFGLGRWLASGGHGSTQWIENPSILGHGLELLDPGACLIVHEVLEVEANFFDSLGDLGIFRSISAVFDHGRCFRGRESTRRSPAILPTPKQGRRTNRDDDVNSGAERSVDAWRHQFRDSEFGMRRLFRVLLLILILPNAGSGRRSRPGADCTGAAAWGVGRM